jgi:transcriptional regulator GlxA family with amidase domain
MTARPWIYLLGFLLAPAMTGVLMTFSSFSEVMIHSEPAPLASAAPAPPARPKGSLPKAVFLVSNQGTEVTDLLGPYQVIAESGAFELHTAAPSRKLSPLGRALSVLPETDLASAPQPDLLVIPAVLDPEDKAIRDWVREKAPRARLVLAVCEGARVAAGAGLLSGRKATSHFLALDSLEEAEPAARWDRSSRFVAEERIITSSGVTGSIDAALAAVERFAGAQAAAQVAHDLGHHWHRGESARARGLSAGDLLQLFLRGGFSWGKREVGVILYPGVSELALAAELDTLPRSLAVRVFTLSPERTPIRSRHGLSLVASATPGDSPRPSVIRLPSGSGTPHGLPPARDPLKDAGLQSWVKAQDAALVNLLYTAPGQAFDQALATLAKLEGDSTAHLVAKLIEHPYDPSRAPALESSVDLGGRIPPWVKLLLVALAGVAVVRFFEQRLFPRSRRSG